MTTVYSNRLKTGDILHCTGHSFISKCIKFFTKSQITHSATFISIWGQPYIFDSQKDGTNLRPFAAWQKKYGYEYIATRSPEAIDEEKFAVNAMTICGVTGYDFELFVLRYPILIIKSWITGGKVVMPAEWGENEKMICSESVAWEHGIKNSQDYTPDKLLRYCEQNDWITVEKYKP